MAFLAKGLPVLQDTLSTMVDGPDVVHFEVLLSSAHAACIPIRFEYLIPNTRRELIPVENRVTIHLTSSSTADALEGGQAHHRCADKQARFPTTDRETLDRQATVLP